MGVQARKLPDLQGLVIGLAAMSFLGAGMVLFELHSEPGAGPLLTNGKLSDAQAEATKVMLDLFQLVMSWALAIIGAAGFFLKLNLEKGFPLRRVDLLFSLAIIVAAVMSLFFGHLAINRTADLLAFAQFPVENAGLRGLGTYQYISFFLAVLLFGAHIFQFFWARIFSSADDPPNGVKP